MSTNQEQVGEGIERPRSELASDVVAVGPPPERRVSRRVLPLVPLRGHVPMPGMPMPISVGRPVSVAAVKAAAASGNEVALAMQSDPSIDDPGPEHMHDF